MFDNEYDDNDYFSAVISIIIIIIELTYFYETLWTEYY
jgi:hypothetical protein